MTRPLLLAMLALFAATAAQAHTGDGIGGGFLSGFTHPLFGWDHVIAMVAVGLWGAFLGAPAIWLLPIVFPLVMASVARWAWRASPSRWWKPVSPPRASSSA
jgi:urease accessory protein